VTFPGEIFVTVIVCTYNHADLLTRCLQSLAEQTIPIERYEVIVVENACTDQTTSVVEHFALHHSHFRLVREPQPGKSRALNTGIRCARGTHVAFIDDDARASRQWVEQITRAFANTVPTPAVVVGNVLPIYEQSPPSWWEHWRGHDPEQPATFLKPGWGLYKVDGANLAFHKGTLLECGGFAVNLGPVGGLFRTGEDAEAAIRVAASHPYVWYDPRITVEHWVPAEKMALSYLIWRRYLSGMAISEIEKTVLLSSRSLAALRAWMRRLFTRKTEGSTASYRADHVSSFSSPPLGSRRLQVLSISLVLWLAEKAGRIRGARIF